MDKELKKLSRIEILELMLSQTDDIDNLSKLNKELERKLEKANFDLNALKQTNLDLSNSVDFSAINNEKIEELENKLLVQEESFKKELDDLRKEKDNVTNKYNAIKDEFNTLKQAMITENNNLHQTLKLYEGKLSKLNDYKAILEEEYQNKEKDLKEKLNNSLVSNKEEYKKILLEAKQAQNDAKAKLLEAKQSEEEAEQKILEANKLKEEAEKKLSDAKSISDLTNVVLSVISSEENIEELLKIVKDNKHHQNKA